MSASGEERYPHLFSELPLRLATLCSRVVMPPMVTMVEADDPRSVEYYRRRAAGGVGLIILQAVRLHKFDEPGFAERLQPVVEALHAEGAAVAVQLFQNPEVDGEAVAPSAGNGAREVTTSEIETMVQSFISVGRQCADAGFDGVEPHGAHSFFLNWFFSPQRNRRTDRYGDSLEGRMQFAKEIFQGLKAEIADRCMLLYRHTPVEGGGYTIEDTIAFMRELQRIGLDVIDISPSTPPDGEHAAWAAPVKVAVDVPVIAVGGMEQPAQAEEALAQGKCDLVAIGRGLIAEPEWANKVREGREEEIIECIKCDEMCFGNLSRGEPISCTQNPDAGP